MKCFQSLRSSLLLLNNPIVLTVVLVSLFGHKTLEEASQIGIVGLFFKKTVLAILDIFGKLFGRSTTKLFDGCLNLLLLNTIVLIVLILASETLPGQSTLIEIKKDVTDGLQIISSCLFDTDMSVD